MGIKKNRFIGLGLLTAVSTAAIVLYAVLGNLPEASAQNPGISSTKDSIPLPAAGPKSGGTKSATYVVKKDQIIKDIVLTGELRAERSIQISAPRIQSSFSNTVTFLAPEGSIVKTGERIVEFDDSSLLSSKSEADRTLDEAKLNILKKKADLEADRCDLLNSLAQAESSLKQDELYGKISKSLLPANDYQKYQLNVSKSKLSVEKAKEQLSNFERSYASQMALVEISRSQAEINLKKIESDMLLLKIDAPQDGIFIYGDNWQSNRKVQPGDNIFPGMEVASLPDLTSMQVLGYVYDTEYSVLKPDMRCTVRLDALPDFKAGGKVISLTSVASRKGFSSTKKLFQTIVRLDRIDASVMKPGMTARVNVPLVLAKETLAVPREYLGIDSLGRNFVIKGADPKKSQTQPVKLGAIGDRLIEIVSGISVGDTLIPVQLLAEVSK
jgi:HlyD family secretion protein